LGQSAEIPAPNAEFGRPIAGKRTPGSRESRRAEVEARAIAGAGRGRAGGRAGW
jgi:hypothetical protein